jgi:hypothetical protein
MSFDLSSFPDWATGHRDRALAIVEKLAAGKEPIDGEEGYCTLCFEYIYTSITDHEPSCPYRLAVELMKERKP